MMFRLRIGRVGLEYDSDYGIARRSGWSLTWHGSYLVELDSLWACMHALVTRWPMA
jgi:hypothetical protein